MRRSISFISIVFQLGVGLLIATGCSRVTTLCHRTPPPVLPPAAWIPPPPQFHEPGELFGDLSAVAGLDETFSALGDDFAPPGYVAMTPQTLQCMAAAAASTPALIDKEIELLLYLAHVSKDRATRVYLIQRDLSELRAATLRNEAAGAALKVYYQIAAAEAQRKLLPQLREKIDRVQSLIDDYKDTGIDIPADETEFQRQEYALREQEAQLKVTLAELNGQIRLLLAAPLGPAPYIWPQDDFHVFAAPLDVSAEITLGLQTRTDIISLAIIHQVLDRDTLPLARAALQQRDGVLGIQSTSRNFGHKDRILKELEVRDVQLAMMRTDAIHSATLKIRQAALDAMQQLRAVGAAASRVQSRRERLDTIRNRIEVNRALLYEKPLAELEVLRAKSELIQKIVEWKIALVQLKEAQGLLAAECGYPRSFCCQHSCGGNQRRDDFCGDSHPPVAAGSFGLEDGDAPVELAPLPPTEPETVHIRKEIRKGPAPPLPPFKNVKQ